MTTLLKNRLSLLFLCLFAASAAYGQNAAPELNITLGEQRVRFAPTRGFQEMRLEVVNSVGEIVFTHTTTEAEFDWNLRAANSEALVPGLYRYALALKFSEDQTRQHTGHFIVEKGQDQIWLTASEGTEVSGTVLSASRSGGRSITGLGSKDDKSVKRDASGREISDKVADSTKAVKQEKAALLGTANMVAKYDVGGVNLIDSAITEVGGNVGIGITTPTSILEMVRPGVTDVVFKMQNATRAWSVGVSGTGDLWRIRDNTAGAARLAVTGGTGLTGGYVGIGVTAPAAKLEVAGDIRSSALRQELTAYTPNIINGFMGTGSGGATPGNRVTAGVVGAAIGGGGFNGNLTFPTAPASTDDKSNRVTDWFGTVGGGFNNRAGDDDATLDSARYATVGGGTGNVASSFSAFVGGGSGNVASGTSAFVGGGQGNIANNARATVAGGDFNTASNNASFVGGGNANQATGGRSAVAGGQGNTASGNLSAIAGGLSNTAAGDYSTAGGRRAKANHAGSFVWADSTDADFASSDVNQFLIRAAGGVGIGTTSPAAKLHVNGGNLSVTGGTLNGDGSGLTNLNAANLATGTLPIARGGTGITTAPTAAGQFLRSSGANTWAVGSLAASDLPGGSINYIQNGMGQQAANFNVSGSGSVGFNLSAGQDLNANRFVMADSAGQFDGVFGSNIGGKLIFGGDNSQGIGSKRTVGGNQNGLDFYTNVTSRLSITNSGNVGIGTNGTGGFRLNVYNAGSEGLRVATDTAGGRVASFGGSGTFDIDAPFVGGGRLTVLENGNVGIAEANPTQKLWVNGNSCSNNYPCASDARLKTQVTGLRYGLQQLMQLRPVSWKWKDAAEQQLPLGLIAQEVEPVMPELVMHPAEASGTLGLNYMGLLPVMVKATQEQQAQIQQLLQANQQQQTQIQQMLQANQQTQQLNRSLRQRLNRLERQVKTRRR